MPPKRRVAAPAPAPEPSPLSLELKEGISEEDILSPVSASPAKKIKMKLAPELFPYFIRMVKYLTSDMNERELSSDAEIQQSLISEYGLDKQFIMQEGFQRKYEHLRQQHNDDKDLQQLVRNFDEAAVSHASGSGGIGSRRVFLETSEKLAGHITTLIGGQGIVVRSAAKGRKKKRKYKQRKHKKYKRSKRSKRSKEYKISKRSKRSKRSKM